MSEPIDFALISQDTHVVKFITKFCEDMNYAFKIWSNEVAFFEDQEKDLVKIRMIMISALSDSNMNGITQKIQAAKLFCPKGFVCCVVPQKIPKEEAAFAIKSGANVIILETELETSSKLEYFCTHIIRDEFIPIKTTDLTQGMVLPFNVYYYVSQRNKFLVCGNEGILLNADKFDKMKKQSEFYIKRIDIDKYEGYINDSDYKTTSKIERRCRIQYLTLCWNYAEFVCLLTDYSKFNSFQEGKTLLNSCKDLCGKLINSLAAVDDLWEVINLRVEEGSTISHIPAITAYAGLFALKLDLKTVEDIMITVLLSDVGLIFMHPSINRKMKKNGLKDLTADELAIYKAHPLQGMKIALDRKLPLTRTIRELMENTHEVVDGSGFPRGKRGDALSAESLIIQFAYEYHERSMLRSGKAPISIKDFNQMLLKDATSMERYRPSFVNNMKKFLLC
ncbi:MAG: hypothetical protein HQK52_05135 [Oligoflexia bacterium]|nr:hypothetical protein [Oligoflexia bacterium]